MARRYPYIVIDLDGYYADEGNVYSAHRTLAAAVKASNAKHHRHNGNRVVGVAHNENDRYRAGDTFYGDMPPRFVTEVEAYR